MINYDGWLNILNTPELHNIIKSANTQADAQKILDNARRALVENQSLFTMRSK